MSRKAKQSFQYTLTISELKLEYDYRGKSEIEYYGI